MDNYFTANGALFDNEYRISVRLASCKQLRKTHLIILADTLSFNAQGKVNFKSQDRIASECGVNRGTVINAIKQLREWGLLSAKESKFKETLKLVVNYPNLMRFIQDNETVYHKAKFSPSDEETIADLKENGWIGHDVEKSNIDEYHKNHDVEKPNTRCWKTQQPMLENPTQLDHLLDHVNKTTTTTTREREFFDFNDYQGYASGADAVPVPPRWAVDIYYKAFGHSDLSGSMLQKHFGGFVIYNLSRNAGGVPTGQAQAMFTRWLSNEKPSKAPKPIEKYDAEDRAAIALQAALSGPVIEPAPSFLTPGEEIILKQGVMPVGLRERLSEDEYSEVLKKYGLEG